MNARNGSRDEGAPRILLIAGRPRSGTTLLSDLCNAHADITLTHEFGTFLGLDEPYRSYQKRILSRQWRTQSILRCRTLGPLPKGPRIRRWTISARGHLFALRYVSKLRRYGPGPVGIPAVEATLRDVLPPTAIVGDKMPAYLSQLDRLTPVKELAVAVIHRDCRDVISSHLKLVRTSWRSQQWIRDQDTAEKAAMRWVEATEDIERYQDGLYVIRYEDLVHDPREVLGTLARWLGIDPGGFPDESIASIRDNSIGKYREGLTDQEMEDVIRVAGPTMSRLGYV